MAYTAPGGRKIPKPVVGVPRPAPPRLPKPVAPVRPDPWNPGHVIEGGGAVAAPAPSINRPVPNVPAAPNPAAPWQASATPNAPATTVAVPTAPDWTKWYEGDWRYQQFQGQAQEQQGQMYAKYGMIPDPSGAVDEHGRPRLVADKNADPSSVLSQLAQSLSQTIAQNTNIANNRGTLFSGATAAGANASQRGYDSGLAQAIANLQGGLLDIDKNRSELLSTLYPEFAKLAESVGQAQADATLPKTPAAPAGPTDMSGQYGNPFTTLPKPAGIEQQGQNGRLTPAARKNRKKKRGGATQTLTTGGSSFGSAPPPPRNR